MDFLVGMLVVGTIWFWVVSAIMFFIVMVFMENDSQWWGLIVGGVCTFLLIKSTGTVPSDWFVIESPWLAGLYYIIIGGMWSTIKWTLLVKNKATEFKKLRDEFKNIHGGIKSISPQHYNGFHAFMKNAGYRSYDAEYIYDKKGGVTDAKFDPRPSVSRFTYKLAHWIMWWPTSVMWMVVDDLFGKIAAIVRSMLRGVYARITDFMFKDLMD